MKKILLIIIIVVVSLGILTTIGIIATKNILSNKYDLPDVVDIDLSEIEDGIYNGSYQYSNNIYYAEVEIADHQFVNITITSDSKESNQSYVEQAIAVIDRVISTQSLEVDTISGATRSSKAILLAIQDALNH